VHPIPSIALLQALLYTWTPLRPLRLPSAFLEELVRSPPPLDPCSFVASSCALSTACYYFVGSLMMWHAHPGFTHPGMPLRERPYVISPPRSLDLSFGHSLTECHHTALHFSVNPQTRFYLPRLVAPTLIEVPPPSLPAKNKTPSTVLLTEFIQFPFPLHAGYTFIFSTFSPLPPSQLM